MFRVVGLLIASAILQLATKAGSPESLQLLVKIASNPAANAAALDGFSVGNDDKANECIEKKVDEVIILKMYSHFPCLKESLWCRRLKLILRWNRVQTMLFWLWKNWSMPILGKWTFPPLMIRFFRILIRKHVYEIDYWLKKGLISRYVAFLILSAFACASPLVLFPLGFGWDS